MGKDGEETCFFNLHYMQASGENEWLEKTREIFSSHNFQIFLIGFTMEQLEVCWKAPLESNS